MQRKGIGKVDQGLGRSLRQVWDVMREMSRMMGTAHGLDASPGSRGKPYEWEPVVSEMPAGGNLLLYFELPGVDREEVNVSIRGRRLIVSGVKKEIEVPDPEDLINGVPSRGTNGSSYLSYAPFRREVELPRYVEEEEIEATFGVGILQVRVADASGQRSRRIQVRGNR